MLERFAAALVDSVTNECVLFYVEFVDFFFKELHRVLLLLKLVLLSTVASHVPRKT